MGMPDALHTSSRGGLVSPVSTSSAELRRLLLVGRVPQRLLRLSRFFSRRFWAPNKALHGVSAIHTERQVMASGLRALVNKDGQEEEESMRRPGWAGHMRLLPTSTAKFPSSPWDVIFCVRAYMLSPTQRC